MKKMIIYQRVPHVEGIRTLRVICVHPTFVGIGPYGVINTFEFRKLAETLEPAMTSYAVLDM